MSTAKLLNNTKNVSINKTLSITTLAQYFYPATLEEHPINNYDPDRVLFWKTCTGKKCINVYTLDLGWYAIEGYLLEQLLKPIHAMTYECYTCYNISIYSETSCGRYADWCSPFGVGAPIPVWALSIFLAEGHGFFKQKTSQLVFESTLPQLRRQQLGARFQHSIYLSIYLSVKIQHGLLPFTNIKALSLIAQQTKRRVCTTELDFSW